MTSNDTNDEESSVGLPDYLTTSTDEIDLTEFRSRVEYVIEGEMIESEDFENTPRRGGYGGEVIHSEETTVTFLEDLERSIINIEAWLHGHWRETIEIPEEMDVNGKQFFVEDIELRFDLVIDEIIKASRVRAKEDSTHFLYVLGNWTYLATNNSHVNYEVKRRLHRAFNRAEDNCLNAPGDATVEEFGGGAE